jgi:multidrug efflux pump subunit AcrA (membrane-fusion protein)
MKSRKLFMLLAAFGLAGCSAISNPTPQPLPTIVLDNDTASTQASSLTGGVTASGEVAPAQQSLISFATAGNVDTVNIAVGDQVTAGQVLIELNGSEKMAAEVESAKQELLSAQQAFDNLNKDMDVKRAEAQKTIADNRDAVRDAQRYLDNIQTQAGQADIDQAYANMIIAKDKLEKAQKDFKPYENKAEDNIVRAGLLSRLAQAQKDYDNLVTRYNNLRGTAGEIDLAQAQADLAMAQANLAKSERDYEILQKGPDPDEVALAQARLVTAKAQLEAAQSAQNDLVLLAPFDGTVTSLNTHPKEWVSPGQTVLQLSDLQHLRVETTDLSERDIPQIRIGQAVTVYVKALKQDVSGRVSEIAPLADVLGGDVVYKVTIDLDQPPAGLRAGMSVEAQFGQ